jgi:uncharacterized protein
MLPRCEACGRFHFYPRAQCPHCGSDRIEWSEASGRGTVYSFTHVHRAPSPAFEKDVPYVVVIVELGEGPHLMSSLVNCKPGDVRIGQPVEVRYFDRGDATLVAFEPLSCGQS